MDLRYHARVCVTVSGSRLLAIGVLNKSLAVPHTTFNESRPDGRMIQIGEL